MIEILAEGLGMGLVLGFVWTVYQAVRKGRSNGNETKE